MRRYLCSDQGQHGAFVRAVSFLLGLFEETRSVLSILSTSGHFPHDYGHGVLECGSNLVADKFRTYMWYRATYKSHGPFRRQFYEKVITRAKKVCFISPLTPLHVSADTSFSQSRSMLTLTIHSKQAPICLRVADA